MLVANSFDLWKKDAFFSAAEEVQESADIMESAYRRWLRERREGLTLELLDEVSRELQTALGTAKWQLEEFARAVRMSYGSCSNDSSTTRHGQFIAAIENQISNVEESLRVFFNEEGNQPLRWVKLDEEECDDLAMFLSGGSEVSQPAEDAFVNVTLSQGSLMRENYNKRKDFDSSLDSSRDNLHERGNSKDVDTVHNDAKYVIDIEAKETPGTRDDINCQADRASASRRTWSSPNTGTWKIVIADADEQRNESALSIEATPKEKESKPFFWKEIRGELLETKGATPNSIHLRSLFGRFSRFQRQPHSPQRQNSKFGCSVRVTLALMLSIFLIVPFLVYSN